MLAKRISRGLLNENGLNEEENIKIINKNLHRLKQTEKMISTSESGFNKSQFLAFSNKFDQSLLKIPNGNDPNASSNENDAADDKDATTPMKKKYGKFFSGNKSITKKGEIFIIKETSENEESGVLNKKNDSQNKIKRCLDDELNESQISEKDDEDVRSSRSKIGDNDHSQPSTARKMFNNEYNNDINTDSPGNHINENENMDRYSDNHELTSESKLRQDEILDENYEMGTGLLKKDIDNNNNQPSNLIGESLDPKYAFNDTQTTDTKNLIQLAERKNLTNRTGEIDNSIIGSHRLLTPSTIKKIEDKPNKISNNNQNGDIKRNNSILINQEGYSNNTEDQKIQQKGTILSIDKSIDHKYNKLVSDQNSEVSEKNKNNMREELKDSQASSIRSSKLNISHSHAYFEQQDASDDSISLNGKNIISSIIKTSNNLDDEKKNNFSPNGGNTKTPRVNNTNNYNDNFTPNHKSDNLNNNNATNVENQDASQNDVDNDSKENANQDLNNAELNTLGKSQPLSTQNRNDNSFDLMLDQGENFNDKANESDFRNPSFNSIQMGSSLQKNDSDNNNDNELGSFNILELGTDTINNNDKKDTQTNIKNNMAATNNNFQYHKKQNSFIEEEESSQRENTSIYENKSPIPANKPDLIKKNLMMNSKTDLNSIQNIDKYASSNKGSNNNSVIGNKSNLNKGLNKLSKNNFVISKKNNLNQRLSKWNDDTLNGGGKNHSKSKKNASNENRTSEIEYPNDNDRNNLTSKKNINKGNRSPDIERKQGKIRATDIANIFNPGSTIKKANSTQKSNDSKIERSLSTNSKNKKNNIDKSNKFSKLNSEPKSNKNQIFNDSKFDNNSKILSNSKNFGDTLKSTQHENRKSKYPHDESNLVKLQRSISDSKFRKISKQKYPKKNYKKLYNSNKFDYLRADHSRRIIFNKKSGQKCYVEIPNRNSSFDDLFRPSPRSKKSMNDSKTLDSKSILDRSLRNHSFDNLLDNSIRKKKSPKYGTRKVHKKLNKLYYGLTSDIVILEADDETSFQNRPTDQSKLDQNSMQISTIKGVNNKNIDELKTSLDSSQYSRYGLLVNRIPDISRRPLTKRADFTQKSRELSYYFNGDSPYMEYLPNLIKREELMMNKTKTDYKSIVKTENEIQKKTNRLKEINNLYGAPTIKKTQSSKQI